MSSFEQGLVLGAAATGGLTAVGLLISAAFDLRRTHPRRRGKHRGGRTLTAPRSDDGRR